MTDTRNTGLQPTCLLPVHDLRFDSVHKGKAKADIVDAHSEPSYKDLCVKSGPACPRPAHVHAGCLTAQWTAAAAQLRELLRAAAQRQRRAAMPHVDERSIPLNVRTYREGWLRLRGWACFSALALLTGALPGKGGWQMLVLRFRHKG